MNTKKLEANRLVFDRGCSDFLPEDFTKTVSPYFADLNRVGRTNFLFAAVVEGQSPQVTGYATDTTINATINSRVLQTEKQGGKWAIYRLT